MKVGKSFTTLLALGLLLGLGVWNSADADPVINPAIVVTSPAAGATLNIASNTVTVEITFNVFDANSKAYTAYVGLASTTDTTKQPSTLNAAATGLMLDDESNAGGEEALFQAVVAVVDTNANSTFAVHTKGTAGRVLGRLTVPVFADGPSAALNLGNVTSSSIEADESDKVTLTVTLTVGSDAGTESGVVAFAVVRNTTDGTNSTLVFSPVAGAFGGDWDGPEIGTATISSTVARASGTDPATVAGGTAASLAPVVVGDVFTGLVTASGHTQTELFFTKTTTAQVVLTLSPANGAGITLPVDPDARNADGSAAQVTYTFLATDFLDADGLGSNVSDERQVIAAVQLVDSNGNPTAAETGLTEAASDAAIVVIGNTDAPTFSGAASAAVQTAFDNIPPVLAFAASAGVLPATDGTISDGGLNASDATLPSDGYGNAAVDTDADGTDDIDAIANSGLLQFENAEALKTLVVNFKGNSEDVTFTLTNTGNTLTNTGLDKAAADEVRVIDFSALAAPQVTTSFDANGNRAVLAGAAGSATFSGAGTPTAFADGSYAVTYTGTDLADNASNSLAASNVWVDRTDPSFASLAPPVTETTINTNTANPTYVLNEALSVLELTIASYDPATTLLDTAAPHIVHGAGTFLSDTSKEHSLPITSKLVDDGVYTFTFRLRDVHGNWSTVVNTPQRTYDVEFEEAIIAKFSVAVTTTNNLGGTDAALTIQAQSADNRGAGTYEGTATLSLTCNDIKATLCATCDAKAFPDCSGVTITGDGITAAGANTWSLDSGWDSVGSRTGTVKNESATIQFSLTVTDDTLEGGPYTGSSGNVSYSPKAYTAINLWTGDAVSGSVFSVNVEATDEFGNIRWEDDRLINLTAGRPANLPGSVLLKAGTGTVSATASAGQLDILASDPIALVASATAMGDNFLTGSLSVEVGASAGPSAPGEVVAADHLGADGTGDHGGFIVLTFTVPDGSSATAYQISREVKVYYDIDAETGDLVHLGDGADAFIPWGTVAATGDNPQRVIVATLDNVATRWGVNGTLTVVAKQAFDGAVAVTTPYELMSQTMVESRKLAQLGPNVPVFAELTPDALSFIDGSFAPRFKDASGATLESDMAITVEAVRAIDNIAPEPVSLIQAVDTPNDKGGSITVTWLQSESDGLLARTSSGAVGPDNSDTVLGVKGYNIYRSVLGGEDSMVGKVAPGVSSFIDQTALNGRHYDYSVVPYDDDNLATSELSSTALSVRNIAFDSEGGLVQGLYGADNQVGFDDFFVFADHFGQVGGAIGFDPAFDLAPDNQINFFDFFVFADNFGRVAVGASKVVPLAAGLNDNARIDLATELLPSVGEEMVVNISLADFTELKGYGFTVNFDPTTFEFVRVEGLDARFGSEEIAQPQVINDGEGQLSVVGYGQTLSDGELMLDLVLRPIMETENGLIEVSRGELADVSLAFNQIASLGAIAVETRPEEFALQNNYPNPFNPSTTIKYQLPDAVDVRLEIYNVVGQVVRTLIGEQQNAGRYEYQWDATNNNGQSLSSGIYFYRLQAGEFQEVKKMLLMK